MSLKTKLIAFNPTCLSQSNFHEYKIYYINAAAPGSPCTGHRQYYITIRYGFILEVCENVPNTSNI